MCVNRDDCNGCPFYITKCTFEEPKPRTWFDEETITITIKAAPEIENVPEKAEAPAPVVPVVPAAPVVEEAPEQPADKKDSFLRATRINNSKMHLPGLERFIETL